MIPKSVAFGLLVIGVAYFYRRRYKDGNLSQEDLIADAWREKIRLPSKQFERVMIGLNANVDLILKGTDLLRALNIKPGRKADHATVANLQELQEIFSHYLSKGSAAERNFADLKVYNEVVAAADSLNDIEWFVGGNAALMAQKIVTTFPNAKVQLVGPVGPRLKSLLHPDVIIPAASLQEQDEVHMIMEYGREETWGTYTAPVANRFITSHDVANGQATMMNTFFTSLNQFKPDLVVLSGLHLLEGQPEEHWTAKLNELSQELRKVPDSIPVHLELASMTNPKFLKLILDKVVFYVSSVGFNEQELGFLSFVGEGPHWKTFYKPSKEQKKEKVLPEVSSLGLNEQEISFASNTADGPHGDMLNNNGGKQPEVDKIGDMVMWALKKYAYSKNNPKSKLTRVHFHSLTYHIMGIVPAAWSNVESAVAAGTRIAGKQACDMSIIDSEKVDLKIPGEFSLFNGDAVREFNASSPVLTWNREGFHFAFSPVLVCKKPLKTVGLGDAISATGLLYSQYNANFRQ